MKLRWGILSVGAACAACRIPLLAPLLGIASLSALGGAVFFGVTLEQVLRLGLPVAALLVFAFVWWRRAKAAQSCACEASCDVETCAPAKTPYPTGPAAS